MTASGSSPTTPPDADAAAIAAAWADATARVAASALRAGRRPEAVRIVAATKTVPVERIRALLAAGCTDLGENRAQELVAKAPELAHEVAGGPPTWHFIGPLQRNKIRALAPLVSCWHTVDRPALVPGIAGHAPGATVLVEVNLAREPQKAGCDPDDVAALVGQADRAGLRVVGLMTVPPRGGDPRPWFAELAARAADLGLAECSMGMSEDFEVAVEEGATMVRLGRVLLGARPANPADGSGDGPRDGPGDVPGFGGSPG
ncbi:MAG: YggS family pyridoxal phosphate-dependent enzyme [Acidimicrobiia bacterium]